MTIDEAIEKNEHVRAVVELSGAPISAEAIGLGIEALKRVKVARISKSLCPRGPLPGETEDKGET